MPRARMSAPEAVIIGTCRQRMAHISILLALGCAAALAASAARELRIEDGWVRAMPPNARMTAAYMTLSNPGDSAISIRGASSPDAADVSLHETRSTADGVTMRAVESLTIEPGEQVQLEPGGLHLMLMGLDVPPRAGNSLSLCITTSVEEQCMQLPVSRQAPQAAGRQDQEKHNE